MKNNKLKIATLGFTIGLLLAGCKPINLLDSKTTITIEPFSASGYGIDYLKNIGNEWSQQYLDGKYKVHVKSNSLKNGVDQVAEIDSNSTNTDVYFGGDPKYSKGFYKGYFEDLTDFVELEPDNDGVSIKDKIPNYDAWKKSASKLNWTSAQSDPTYEGLYMIPFSRTFIGLVFDYEDFYEKGLLCFASNDSATKSELTSQGIGFREGTAAEGARGYLVYEGNTESDYLKNGQKIPSKGNDGFYGTYDDGQPQTFDEFADQLETIRNLGYSTVAFASNPGDCYLQNLLEALFAQSAGLDSYYALASFDSKNPIQLVDDSGNDSEKTTITWNNGYKAYKSKWIKESIDKVYNLIAKSSTKSVTGARVSNTQGAYIAGFNKDNTDHICYLVEGNWWEKEADERLTNAQAYGPGKFKDFRMMAMPSFEGGYGLDGEGHGKVYSAPECGAICVRKQNDPEKLAAIKDFLLYFLKNESLAKITASTGLFFGYNYTISDNYYSQMSPFIKYCYNVMQDEDNCKVLSRAVDMMAAPFSFTCGIEYHAGSDLFPIMDGSEIDSVTKQCFLDKRADSTYDTSNIWRTIRNTYSEAQWNAFVNTSLAQFAAWNQ